VTDVLLERPGGVHAAPSPSRHGRSERRSDIEGLRAIAVLGVLAFHAGLPFVPGGYVGVDVFFVISGFLITGLVAAEMRETGRVSFPRFYARRIKRLLPAAGLVLVVTAAASAVIMSPLARGLAGDDIVSAALYVSNWHFAAQQTDYLAVNTSPSPVLHYWSLSVEEQYYVLWPLILVGTVWIARRRSLVAARAVLLAVLAVGLLSLVWSIVWTGVNPPFAFFGTMTRAWELALGGLLALTAGAWTRATPLARALVGWLGLAAIVWSMLVLNEDVPFPGTAALVPALGAAGVLAAGLPRLAGRRSRASTVDPGPGFLLALRPMRSVGRVSYSLYLWHWPPLVLVPIAIGAPLTPLAGCVVVALAAVPAVLSHRYVEEPFRRSTRLVDLPRRAAVLAVVVTVAGVGAGVLLGSTAPATVIDVSVPQSNGTVTQVKLDPSTARQDVPSPYNDGCHAGFRDKVPKSCVYGDKKSKQRVALLGDSHAIQWFPALEPLAKAEGWALEVDTKSSCSAGDVTQYEKKNIHRVYTECPIWRNELLQRWTDDPASRPDVVIVASRDLLTVMDGGTRLSAVASLQAQRAGLERTFTRLEGLGIRVVLIGDVLSPGFDEPDCLSTHLDDPMACSFDAAGAAPQLAADRAAAAAAGVPVIEVTPTLCPDGTCPPIHDGVMVYRDGHHLTATYVQTLEPLIREQLAKTPAWMTLTSS
jgi:peptidoglycan/LPS O-acetylase OafA/YrhL